MTADLKLKEIKLNGKKLTDKGMSRGITHNFLCLDYG